jgi:hypothetical protein
MCQCAVLAGSTIPYTPPFDYMQALHYDCHRRAVKEDATTIVNGNAKRLLKM